ncbi:MAG: HAMP domain-containing protein [Gemmatimonadaceae bacterium]|nr:HAMP domain-containing protein [Gemmatimonadaceae bacterium]NUQ93961.1 HAMP domain-containing protein [Gemmatimonadaceae bacterium]NUR18320.1 HAMP domain-containing protein [Gemmatimonadaceae bacterium]NUS95888.1 HAMP domain-containing protein [Gemmatimonadaceae bacterium]
MSSTPGPASHARLRSLRTELLIGLGLTGAAALVIAMVTTVLYSWTLTDDPYGALWLVLLVAGDVAVFVALGAYIVRRSVSAPLALAVDATSAIAAGDLTRRVPDATTRELAVLAASINRMTNHLLAEQVQRVRAEKLAGIGRLAAGVAHEIGNPLAAINGYSHVLHSRVRGDAEALEALEGLERESARIDRIVRGLLDYARPRRNTPGRIEVNDAVRSALQLLRDQGLFRRVELSLKLDESTPVISGERHEMEQMLVNLCLNATDAMNGAGRLAVVTQRLTRASLEENIGRRAGDPEGKVVPRQPSPRVLHWLDTTKPPAEVLKIVVADSGPGIAEADEERIFDPFFTTKEPGKGTGLGLAIVARVVEDLGGTIWVQRAREGGAAFHALFPIPAYLPVRAPSGVSFVERAPRGAAR